MSAFSFVLRALFLGFFVLNGLNLLGDIKTHANKFQNDYVNLHTHVEKYVKDLPQFLHHSNVSPLAAQIVYYLAWSQIFLAVLSIFNRKVMILLGLCYFLREQVKLKAFHAWKNQGLQEFEEWLVSVALLVACFRFATAGRQRARENKH